MEKNKLSIQNQISNENSKHRGKKYVPYVFTEQGIAMLSGLLKNDIAVQVSINIKLLKEINFTIDSLL